MARPEGKSMAMCSSSTIMSLNSVDYLSRLGGFYYNLSATSIWFRVFALYRTTRLFKPIKLLV